MSALAGAILAAARTLEMEADARRQWGEARQEVSDVR